MVTPEEVLAFWLNQAKPEDWYKQDEAFDALIREKFLESWETAKGGGLALWLSDPTTTLAFIILTDQFPRNMFRDSGDAFATDQLALVAAKMAVDNQWDSKIDEPARQFFYLPLMHSENLCDQDRLCHQAQWRCSRQRSKMPPSVHVYAVIVRFCEQRIDEEELDVEPWREDSINQRLFKRNSARAWVRICVGR